jgi:muramoyltetrapeptide carboxypeptidase
MKTSPFLNAGDTIGIAATARKISEKELVNALSIFKSWGLKVELAPNLFKIDNQFAGTDKERAADFNYLVKQPHVKAIICARGGYGSARMVDLIDWKAFGQTPKWVVGFSDVTVLHNHINKNLDIATVHGAMCLGMDAEHAEKAEAQESIRKVLFGELPTYGLVSHPLNKKGDAKGRFIGGNLSVLYSILESSSFPETNGAILFLEDLDEYLYHIDRMMIGLKRAGKLENLKALIVGGMTDMNDNTVPFGKTAEEIIYSIVKEYNYPIYFGFSAGHVDKNLALPIGIQARIENNRLKF